MNSYKRWTSLSTILIVYILLLSPCLHAQSTNKDSLTIRPRLNEFETPNPVKVDSVSPIDITDESQNLNYLPKWYEMVTNVSGDCWKFAKQEATIDNLPKYLGIAVLTAGLIATDNKTYEMSNRFYHESSFNKNFSEVFTAIGDGRSQFGLAAVFAAYGLIAKDNRAIRTGSEIVEAVLASGAVVQLIKHITGRQDPDASTKPGGVWDFFPNQIQYLKHTSVYDAFPSGHLTTSFAAFMVIANNYFEQSWIRPVSYAIACMVAVGMVAKGIHWYGDYPLAIDLGYVFADIVTNPIIDNNTSVSKKLSYNIGPYYNGIATGLSFTLSY